MTHTQLRQLLKSLNVTYSKTPKTQVMLADLDAMCIGQFSELTCELPAPPVPATPEAPAVATTTTTAVTTTPTQAPMETINRATVTRAFVLALTVVAHTLDSVLLTTVLAVEAVWEHRHYALYCFSLVLAATWLISRSKQVRTLAAVTTTAVLTTTAVTAIATRKAWSTTVWLAEPAFGIR